jgi:acetyl-CoA acyltransferase
MSMVPMGGNKVSPNPQLVSTYPDVYLSTGLVAENHARESKISRIEQDQFALRSHQRAVSAIEKGHFKNEIVPLTVRVVESNGDKPKVKEIAFDTDEGPRRDTSLEALAKLKPAFHVSGTVTAGNSSQTSDGAAAVILTSADLARERGLTPLARFVGYATAGVAPEFFGIGPVPAIRKVLAQTGLTLDQIDLIELNEAFAAQALACINELKLDPEKVNVNGGAIALGHPLGCTGAKLTATLINELHRRNARYGMVTMCVGGGMGAAGIFERL